jgi:hypothetical protein
MPPPSHAHFHVLLLFESFGSLLSSSLLTTFVLLLALSKDWLPLFDLIVFSSDTLSTFDTMFGLCMRTKNNIDIKKIPATRQITLAITCNDDIGASISSSWANVREVQVPRYLQEYVGVARSEKIRVEGLRY